MRQLLSPGADASSQSRHSNTPRVLSGRGKTKTPSQYSVFIGHKIKDTTVAKIVLKLLDANTANFISDNIQKGKDWRKEIAQALSRSNFLILLFTDPNEDWG
jgi:hypothetical protein